MNETEADSQDMKQYYVLGGVVLVAVVVAGFMLRNKTSMAPVTSPQQETTAPAPVLGSITKLACDTQYYNQKIGFPEYYFSVEGGDLSTASKVDCTFTVSAGDKEVATTKITSPLTDKPERGGGTFRCTTKAISAQPNVPTLVEVALKDDTGATATCSAPFLLPAP